MLHFYRMVFGFFFFKQKTAYEMRISDWSSDVCSSDLPGVVQDLAFELAGFPAGVAEHDNVIVRTFAESDRTQDVARSGDVQAIGDFHARFPAARLAMHDKAALRLHRAAPEHDRFVGEAVVLEFHLFHHLAELEIGWAIDDQADRDRKSKRLNS